MSIDIVWNKPTLTADVTYRIRIFRSVGHENDSYSQIDEINATSSGLDVTLYTDSTGVSSYFYYVKYINQTTGDVGDRVLARIDLTVREQRLAEQVYQMVPEVIKARFNNDPKYFVVRRAVNDGLNTINMHWPVTSYTLDNLPSGYESLVVVVAQAYIYMEQYLGVAIRDISFAGGIPSVSIDRGARINTAVQQLLNHLKEYIAIFKMSDSPQPIGLGSEAISVPQGRVFGFLYNR